MKDDFRKSRNWDNDNYIMRKYGGSIRAAMARSLMRSQASMIGYRIVEECRKAELENIPIERCANA